MIDRGGRTLMPGLIDAHWHTLLSAVKAPNCQQAQPDYSHVTMGVEAETTLMRGLITIRDTGGLGFGVKQAVDEGLIIDPRSGALLAQTSGHADRTMPF